MARSNPLDLLRTAAREGVHAGVSVGGKALGHAATLARSGLVRGQAAVTAATARRQQPPSRPARDTPDADLPEPPVEVEEEEPAEAPPTPTPRRTSSPSSAPSPAEVAKRAKPRPAGRPPAKKAARKAPSGPGAKLPPRREPEQD